MAAVSVIIPVYNALEYARQCLESVYSAVTKAEYEVILVNNGSAPNVAAWLEDETGRRARLTILTFDRPLGFARAVNEGARAAQGDFLVLLNSDAAVTDGWIDGLLKSMNSDPGLGIVSPVSDYCGPGKQLVERPPEKSVRLPLIEEPRRLFFFCVMIRSQVWERLEGLDEIYGVGTYEDDDFCLRTRLAGWRMAVDPNVFVRNHASKTFEENRIDHDEWLFRNERIFLERACNLSRSSPGAPNDKKAIPSISVIVTVPEGGEDRLAGSLISLLNQTVSGFQTVVVPEGSPSEAARGEFLAYLLAGDTYFPYHLELLHNALSESGCDAVYAGWSVAIQSAGKVKRAAMRDFDSTPERAPAVCWMHRRSYVRGEGIVQFVPGVTCESGNDTAGNAAIVGRYEREYRARRMLQRKAEPITDEAIIREATRRLSATPATQRVEPEDGKVDFLFLNILGWKDLTQRPHHFAGCLGKRGHRVFWIDVRLIPADRFTGQIVPRLLTHNVWEVQMPGIASDIYHFGWNPAALDLMTGVLGKLREEQGIRRAVQLVNFPGWTPLALSAREKFGWPIVYDCLDDQHAFSELFAQSGVAAYEGRLTDSCDLLVTSGYRLFDTKRSKRDDAILIRNGADFNVFGSAASQGLLDGFPRPVIGFFGAFADWLDLDWIAEAAERFPSWSFVYIGSAGFARQENRDRWLAVTAAENIHVLPQVDTRTLAAYLTQFDVCTMPFQDLPITRSMHAVKIYEYLAAGKHVLVPALPEMEQFAAGGWIATYESYAESFALLETLARQSPTEDQIHARASFAERNDWTERIDRLLEAVKALPKSVA